MAPTPRCGVSVCWVGFLSVCPRFFLAYFPYYKLKGNGPNPPKNEENEKSEGLKIGIWEPKTQKNSRKVVFRVFWGTWVPILGIFGSFCGYGFWVPNRPPPPGGSAWVGRHSDLEKWVGESPPPGFVKNNSLLDTPFTDLYARWLSCFCVSIMR